MRISVERIKKLKPCQDGYDWYLEHGCSDLLTTLLRVNKSNPSWARWLFTKLMTNKQNVEIAIFSAEQVLNIFEKKYSNDDRPRKAILAAKRYLKVPTLQNKTNADAAADAAYASAYAAAYTAFTSIIWRTATAANAYAANAACAATAREKQKEILLDMIIKGVETGDVY